MPKGLIDRFRTECIQEFRAAASQRYLDGVTLMSQSRRTAAIYLWGYAAEMTLKAAYFQAVGFPASQRIVNADLKSARNTATGWQIQFRNYHDLHCWGQLLVETHIRSPIMGHSRGGMGSQVLAHTKSLDQVWRETIRYHKNVAYPHEANRMLSGVDWLLTHSLDL